MAKSANARKADVTVLVPGIVRGGQNLDKLLSEVATLGKNYHDKLHLAAVSVIIHTAENGQVEHLNRFYRGLPAAYQGAFRQYLIRLAGNSKPDQLATGMGAGPLGWIYPKLENRFDWRVITERKDGASPNGEKWVDIRKQWANDNAQRMLEGKEKGFHRFFDKEQRDGANQDLLFTNADVAEMIKRILKRAEAEKDTVLVDDDVLAMLKAAEQAAERKAEMHNQDPKMPAPPKADANAAKGEMNTVH